MDRKNTHGKRMLDAIGDLVNGNEKFEDVRGVMLNNLDDKDFMRVCLVSKAVYEAKSTLPLLKERQNTAFYEWIKRQYEIIDKRNDPSRRTASAAAESKWKQVEGLTSSIGKRLAWGWSKGMDEYDAWIAHKSIDTQKMNCLGELMEYSRSRID